MGKFKDDWLKRRYNLISRLTELFVTASYWLRARGLELKTRAELHVTSLFKELLNITYMLLSVMVIVLDRVFSENEKSWRVLGGHLA